MRFLPPSAAILLGSSLLLSAQEDKPLVDHVQSGTTTVRDVFGDEKRINDFDGDGWDDLWCAIHPDLKHRNKATDTDGDGVSDYDEMILWRDPFVKGPLPVKLTPEEIAAAEAAAKEAEKLAMEKAERELPAKLAALGDSLRQGFDRSLPDPDFIRPDNAEWKNKLDAAVVRAEADSARLDTKLRQIAIKHGMELSGTDSQGRDWLLAGEDAAGNPIIVHNQNAQAADAINADDLWPGLNPTTPFFPWQNLSLSRNLTGNGVITAAFDASNGARESHQEFGGRVIPKNRVNGVGANHPTTVASVIAGGGILDVFRGATNHGKALKGVAYESIVHSYSLASFPATFAAMIRSGVSFSNHSYVINGGWEITNYAGQQRWLWRYPQFAEDPRLGNYYHYFEAGYGSGQIDGYVREHQTHLPIMCAGNANRFGPGGPVTYVQGPPNTGDSTVPRPWINGDAGHYDTLLAPGTAKNVLTVGSIKDVVGGVVELSDFSGTGPADDGRIKPDVVAVGERNPLLNKGISLFAAFAGSDTAYYNGITADSVGWIECEGTSFSAPQVTGGFALAQQRRKQLFPNAGAALASTWRALAIGTAREIGAPGPDFKHGWGIFDALGVVKQLEDDAFHGRGSLIREFEIEHEVPKSFYVTLPAITTARATLAWTDVPRSRNTGSPSWVPYLDDHQYPELINNIGLLIEEVDGNTPTGNVHYPWILNPSHVVQSASERSAPAVNTIVSGVVPKDDRNNVERIDIAPENRVRRFKVTVTPESPLWGQWVGSFYRREKQPVSLILGGFEPEKPENLTMSYLSHTYEGHHFSYAFTSDPGSFYTIETSTTLEAGSWTDIPGMGTIKAEGGTTTVVVIGGNIDTKRFWRAKRGG